MNRQEFEKLKENVGLDLLPIVHGVLVEDVVITADELWGKGNWMLTHLGFLNRYVTIKLNMSLERAFMERMTQLYEPPVPM